MLKPLLVFADQPIVASDAPTAGQIAIADATGIYNVKGLLAPTGPLSAATLTFTPTTITGTGTVAIGASTYTRVNATAGNVAPTLPPAATVPGLTVELFRTDGTGNTVTVTPNGAETINGASTYTGLSSQYAHARLRSNGTSWDIV